MLESLLQGPTLIMLFTFLCFAALLVMFFRLARALDETNRSTQAERRAMLDHLSVMKVQLETLVRTQETQVDIMRSWETQAQQELYADQEALSDLVPVSGPTAQKETTSATFAATDLAATSATGLAAAAAFTAASQPQAAAASATAPPTPVGGEFLVVPDNEVALEPEAPPLIDQFQIQPEDIEFSDTQELTGFDVSEEEQVLNLDESESPESAARPEPTVTDPSFPQVKLDETGEGEGLDFFNDSIEYSLDEAEDTQVDIAQKSSSESRITPGETKTPDEGIDFSHDFLVSEVEPSPLASGAPRAEPELSLELAADESDERVDMPDDVRRELDLLAEDLVDVPDDTSFELSGQEEFEEAEIVLADDESEDMDLFIDEQEGQADVVASSTQTAPAGGTAFAESEGNSTLRFDDQDASASQNTQTGLSLNYEQEYDLELTGMDLLAEEQNGSPQAAAAQQADVSSHASKENIIDFIIEEE